MGGMCKDRRTITSCNTGVNQCHVTHNNKEAEADVWIHSATPTRHVNTDTEHHAILKAMQS